MSTYQRRLCLAADIEQYSVRTNPQQEDGQRRLVRLVDYVCRRAGLFRVGRQPSGDGELLVLPPGVDESRVVPSLVLGLRHGLYENNREPGPFGRIRLRAAVCQGVVATSPAGYVGQAVVTSARLVNSPAVRAGLAEQPAADLALAVPDDLYEDVIRQHHPGLPPETFRRVEVREKTYQGTAWLHTPEPGPAYDPYAARVPWLPVGVALAAAAGSWAAVKTTSGVRDGSGEDGLDDLVGWPDSPDATDEWVDDRADLDHGADL